MSGPLPSRAAIVATAGETIARGSRSFGAASRLFDRPTRERAWLLYAWCRRCDDLADGQALGHGETRVDDAPARIALIRERTDAALAGQWIGDAAFDALRFVVRETGMPRRYIDDVIAGFALDSQGWRPRTEDDLMRYCYHVAGAVGCMMAVVMGVSPEDGDTLDRACDLGIAFQLANIARDIAADDRIGRCYLPADWLAELEIPPEALMQPHYRARLATLAKRLVDRAEAHAESARAGTRALPPRSAWAVLAAAGIYGDIGRGVVAAGERAWDGRIATSALAKLGWIVRARLAAARERRAAPVPRDPALWTRPR